MLAISLRLRGHPQRQKLIPVSGIAVEAGFSVRLWEWYTNWCVYRRSNVLVVMLSYSKSKTAIYLTNMSNLTATFLSMLWVFIVVVKKMRQLNQIQRMSHSGCFNGFKCVKTDLINLTELFVCVKAVAQWAILLWHINRAVVFESEFTDPCAFLIRSSLHY